MKRAFKLGFRVFLVTCILLLGITTYAAEPEDNLAVSDAVQTAEILSFEEAVKILREQLVERKEICAVSGVSAEIQPSVLFDAALAHTGVGNEGDYLVSCYLGNGSQVYVDENGTTVYQYSVNWRTTQAQEETVSKVISELIPSIKGTTNAETLGNICSFINNEVNYDDYFVAVGLWGESSLGYEQLKQTAYGALIRKTAVCEGYSALFYRLCLECGIDARMICGSLNKNGHAWNIADVTGGGDYYFFDPTNSLYFVGEDIYLETMLQYIPDAEYCSDAFYATYPMPDSPYTISIDYDFDEETGTLTINQNSIPNILSYLGEFGASQNGVNYSFEWPKAVREGTTRIVLPEGLTNIGDYAFHDFANLSYIEIPKTVTAIGKDAFSGCRNLTDIYITDLAAWLNIPRGAFSTEYKLYLNGELLQEVAVPYGVTDIGDFAFYRCGSLTSITIPNSVKSIGDYAFADCSNLASVTLSDNITRIGDYAFSECGSLTSINISENVRAIGGSAFSQCKLTSNTLPETLVEIGDEAFAGCTFETITIPANVKNLGAGAFRESAVVDVVIGAQIQTIREYTFYQCYNLQSVLIPDTVENIEKYAFAKCRALEQISLPENLKTIGEYAFSDCGLGNINIAGDPAINPPFGDEWVVTLNPCGGNLTETEFRVYRDKLVGPMPVPTREDYTFLGWYTKKTGGEQVTEDMYGHMLETYVIYARWELTNPSTEVTAQGKCGDNLTWTIYSDGRMVISGSGDMVSFANNDEYPWYEHRLSVKRLVLENGVTSIGDNAFFGFLYMEEVTLSQSIHTIPEFAFGLCMELKYVDWPDSITKIGDFAFYLCKQLENVNLNGISSLGFAAFAECESIETINIPGTLKIMGTDVFIQCKKLKTVVIEEGVTTIARDIFRDCISLESVTLPNSVTVLPDNLFSNLPSLVSVKIGAGVKVLSERLFADSTKLKTITLPTGIVSIENGAFYGCTSLTDVYWNRPEEEWNDVRIGIQNEVLNSVTMHWGKKCVCVFFDPANGTPNLYSKLMIAGETYGELPVPSFGDCVFEGWYTDPVAGEKIDENSIVSIDRVHMLYARWSGVYTSGVCSDTMAWSISHDATLIISGSGVMPDYSNNNPAPWKAHSKYINKAVIENTVENISDQAFNGLQDMTEITIPVSARNVGKNAFLSCSALTDVYVESTEIIWDSVTIGSSNGYLTAANFHFAEEKNEVVFSGECGKNVGWELFDDGNLWIFGNGEMESSPWSSYCNSIRKIAIAEGVTSIKDYAFRNLTKTEAVSMANSIVHIGDYAFSGCVMLSEVQVPNSVESINAYAFSGSGLKSVELPDSVAEIGEYIFSECGQLTTVKLPKDMEHIPMGMVEYCTALTQIEIPESVTVIGNSAFLGCTNLTDLIIPQNVRTIAVCAFQDCVKLTEIVIPDSVVTLEGGCFWGCTGLTEVVIPDRVATIGASTFRDCSNLKTVVLSNQITKIDTFIFYGCTSLEQIVIPVDVTNINKGAFRDCTSLTQIEFRGSAPVIESTAFTNVTAIAAYPEGDTNWTETVRQNYGGAITWQSYVVEIAYSGSCGEGLTWDFDEESGALCISGSGAMTNCYKNQVPWHIFRSQILSVDIADDVTTISEYAFTDCDSLMSVELPEGLVSIGYAAFESCDALESVTLPETLEHLGGNAFADCVKLTAVQIPDGITRISEKAFYNCEALVSVTLPDGLQWIDDYAFWCARMTEIWLPESLKQIGDYSFQNCTGLLEITIPDSMTSIGSYAFSYCANLSSITISDSVTSIGDSAFYGCISLTSIMIPEGVTSISYATFKSCTSLTSVTLPESVTDIGENAFTNCTSLSSITIPDSVTSIGGYTFDGCSSLTSITLPDSVTSIGKYAFNGCSSLTSIMIPDSVTSIGSGLFCACSSLTSITIPEGVTSIDAHAFNNCTALEEINFNATAMNDLSSSNRVFYKAGTGGNGITVNIGANVTKIPAFLFYPYGPYQASSYAPKITSVVFADGSVCESIGASAFRYCTSLTSIKFTGNAPTFGDNSIFGGVTATVYYPLDNDFWTETVRQNYGGTLTWVGKCSVHTYESVMTTPACEEQGCITHTCTVCGDSYEEIVAATGHGYEAVVTEPTEEMYGYTTHTCITCGDSYIDGYCIVGNIITSGTCGSEMEWFLDETKTLWICGTGTMDSWLSDTVPWYSYRYSITSIQIGNGVTSIGDYAFFDCFYLTSVSIPDSVTSIGTAAFRECSSLTSITIPEGATSIANNAFYGCTRLTSITVPDSVTSIGSSAFYGCNLISAGPIGGGYNYEFGWTETLPAMAAGGCNNLISVTIPEGVTTIGNRAFDDCESLISVTLPESVTGIGESAFANCTSLSSITIPDSVTSIGGYAFYGCSSLTSIMIPDSVTSIDTHAFYNCTALEEINFNATAMNDLSSSNRVFYRAGISGNGITINVGANVTKIPAYLFFPYSSSSYAPKITSVVFADGSVCESIGASAFRYCTSLASIKFTGSAPAFGDDYVFESVAATAYYPNDNESWTEDVLQNYGGTLTWVPYGEEQLEIVTQPVSQSVVAGNIVTFTVDATGSDLTYQWQYRTSSSGTWKTTTQSGNKTATLTIPGTVGRNGYQYRCVVTDANGNSVTSDAATLTVKAALSITSQPKSVTAKLNDAVSFTVAAFGEGLTYQWQYRSSATGTWKVTTLSGNKTATLKATATTARNGYQYRCVITDADGNSVTSDAATLTVNAALAITTQPQSVTAKLNDAVSFTVAASGEGLTYQWQYRSSATGTWKTTTLTGNKTATLKATATTARNGYQYRCVITDADGNSVTSDAATLTVNAALAITTQPQSVTAKLNDAVSFTVAASGDGLTYQWQYRSSATGTWKNTTLTGAKTATLKATATTARNGYQYRCVIKDAAGNSVTSDVVTLTLKTELAITTQPQSVTAKLNDAVSFTVAASGDGLTYQWQYRSSATGTWKNTTLTGAKTAILKATATTARNGYQYRCVITDAAGNTVTSNAVTLTVKAELAITSQPESVTAAVGDAVSFTVGASGDGLTYQWEYRSSATGTWKVTTLSGYKTSTLKVSATTARNGFQYRCVITDAAGNAVNSDAATLTVN